MTGESGIELWSLDEGEQAGPLWSGPLPPACVEASCEHELQITSAGAAIFTLAYASAAESPEQLWFAGPLRGADTEPLELWGGERLRVDSSDFGPAYELEPVLCGAELHYQLNTREPSAALADAPSYMRDIAATAPEEPKVGECTPIRSRLNR